MNRDLSDAMRTYNEEMDKRRPLQDTLFKGMLKAITENPQFPIGTRVVKRGEDSVFEGVIVAAFVKRNGSTVRYVIENDDGVLHITGSALLKVL